MKVYAFDVDETLEVSNGPVTVRMMIDLRNEGHVVGLCGNWGRFFQVVPDWYHLIQFFNYGQVKNVFLWEIKNWIKAEEYIMVGNVGPLDARTFNLPQSGGSDDLSQSRGAGWRFISEKDFANGMR